MEHVARHWHQTKRPEWAALPQALVDSFEKRVGAAVSGAETQMGGFTPGVAAVVKLNNGKSVFVKAIPCDESVAEGYRREALISKQLPEHFPAPKFRFSEEQSGWILLCFDVASGRLPDWPWTNDQLDAAVKAIDTFSPVADPCPIDGLQTVSSGIAEDLCVWRRLVGSGKSGDLTVERLAPAIRDSLDVLADMEANWESASEGTALVHLDLRLDNMLLDAAGDVTFVDWSSSHLGAPWVDLAVFLPTIGRSAQEMERLFLSTDVGASAAKEGVDGFVAALAGMWIGRSVEAAIPHAPGLRAHQAKCGAASLAWLGSRNVFRQHSTPIVTLDM